MTAFAFNLPDGRFRTLRLGGLFSLAIKAGACGLIGMTCLLAPFRASSASCFPAPSGLVGWWAGEGNGNDSFGTNNGTLQGGVTFTNGEVGQAFNFNGTNQWLDVPNSPSLNPTGSFTIESWVKVTGDGSTTYIIMSKWAGVGVDYRSYGIGIIPGYGLGFAIADAAHQADGVFQTFNTTSNVVPSNVWTHIAAVYNQSNGVRSIYVNGVNIANHTNTPITVLNTPLDPGIGAELANSTTPTGFFVGQIDEVSFYSRALSGPEIQAIYNAGANGKCPSPPVIVTQPSSNTLFVGSTASFGVAANGLRPFGYQWYLGANPISATTNATATNAVLVLTNVQAGLSGGLYSVLVTNSAGQSNSAGGLLTVLTPGVCDPAPSGLVNWWAGEGNASDSFGSSNGLLVGGVTFTNGEVGQAFSFDGTTGYVSNSPVPLLNVVDTYTMEFWAWPTGGRASTPEATSGIYGTSSQRYAIYPVNGYTNPVVGSGVSVGTNGISVFEQAPSYMPSLLVYNATISGWTHIAVVYVNRQPTLYVNGVAVQTGLTSGRSSSPSTPLGEENSGYGFYSGLLDEVSIYNRALSGTEIQAIYNAGSAGKCPSPPVIVTQPASNTLFAGGTASFGVSANGAKPLSYQWYLGTNAISTNVNATATNAVLVLTNVQLGQSGGLYSVLVTNSAGQSNSASALLTVNALPPTCDPPPAGLVSFWKGESNAIDSYGTNNGTLVGGATFTNGEAGQAFYFDGSTAYVDVPDSPSLELTSQITIEAWINPLAISGGQNIVDKINAGIGLNGYQLGLISNNQQLVGQFNSPGMSWPSEFVKASIPVNLGTWNHVAWTYNQSAMILYYNGQPVGTNVIGPQPIATSSSDVYIGNNGPAFTGAIDEVGIYNTALSAAQILAIYNAGTNGKCPSPPVIVTQPASDTLFAGGTASFGVAVNGFKPLSYQWYLGTNAISTASNPTATNALLVLTNVQVGQSGGLYSVLVTNSVGQSNSASALLTVNAAPPCDPVASGLVSWWAGESNANDSFGTNNGTVQGGTTFVTGEVGQAFSFNGSSGTVAIPYSAGLSASNQVTIDFWMNSNPGNPIGSQVEGVVATEFYGIEMAPGNNLYFYLSTNHGTSYLLTSDANAGGLTFPAGQWHHVAATYDGTNMQMYLDGQPAGSPRPAAGLISAMDATSYESLGSENGRSSNDSGRYYWGLLDEVDIYNRALKASEITAIYNAAVSGKCPSPPVIVTQPASNTLFAGGTASFGVAANGAKPLSYQWFLGTNAISAMANSTATNAVLVLTNVQLGQSGGLYSVLVANSAGQSNSASALLTVNPPPPTCDPAPAGLVSWWKGESNASDSFGNNDGVLQGGAIYTNGEVGQAFSFDGVSGTVSVPDSPNLELTSQITIEAWIRPRATNGDQVILGKVSATSGNNGYEFGLTAGNKLFGSFNSPGLPWPSSYVQSPIPIVLGTWNHVAWTYDQSQMILYFNGQPVETNIIGQNPIATSSAALRISGNDNIVYFNGDIDEPAVYSNALSAAQILAIYTAGSLGKCPSPPVIVTQPASNTLFAGQTASFGVAANGFKPLSYQWYLGTNPISAMVNSTATNSVLVLTNVQLGQSGGHYSVLVTNSAGQSNSASVLLTVNAVPPTCDPAPSGLVSWWAGEGNANDSFGTNNGTVQGGTTFTAGEVGQEAFSFNGSSGTVAISNAANLNGGNQMTIDFWMNSNPGNPIGSHIEGVVATEFYGIEMAPGNNLYFYLSTNHGTSYLLTSDANAGGLTFPAGQWHHVAATYDGTNMQMYLDGQRAGNPRPAPGGISAMDSTSYVSLGSENGRSSADSGRYYWGLLDEADIYNRALTSNEIAAIYAAGAAGKCPSPPVIVTQPASNTLFAGGTASFGVVANGMKPLSYQWFLGTNAISAMVNSTATNSVLMLTNVQLGQSGGLYSVHVTNSAGQSNSASALLTVNALPPTCDPAPQGLVSWWAAESNANDSFGNNNGTLVGGVIYTNGEAGQAFYFNGSTADVDVPDSPSLELTNQITIEAWINPVVTNGDQNIVAKISNPTGLNGYQFALTAGNELVGQFNSPGLGWASSYLLYPIPIVPGTWNHVAWTYDQSAMKLYFNGQPVATNVIGPHPIATSSADLNIGNTGPPFNGAIDEVGIYNTALTAAQIQAIYNAGSAGKCPSPPVITTQPVPDTLFTGGTATFGVAANGAKPLSYQWYLGTNPISANVNATATNSVLVLTNVQLGQSGGLYSVLVTNSAGQSNSASVLLTVNPAPPCDPPPAGLVAWWQAEGNALDAAGTNNGNLIGGVTYTNGEVGQAFYFNGSSAYVDVPDSPALQLTNQISIEAWIKPVNANGDQSIVAKIATAGGLHGYQFATHNAQWGAQFNSFPGQAWGNYVINSPVPLALGAWNHVAWTYDQSAMKLYLNGQPVATNVIGAQPIALSAVDLSIGGNGPPFSGAIDELSMYNTALSAAQIQAIYNAAVAGKCELDQTAVVVADVSNGFVVGATVISGGHGYTNTPGVRIIGGGGSGAQGVAVVSNGVVVAVNILDAGSGYTGAPTVVVDPPVIPNPVLGIGPATLLTFTNLNTNNTYQLQEFTAWYWSNIFGSFIATNPVFSQPVSGLPGSVNYRLAQSPVPAQAFATPVTTNGFFIGANLTSGGSGYTSAPAVAIVGGGGTNAAAVAQISGGAVTNIMVTDAGFGYTGTPVIQIAPPPVTAIAPAMTQPMVRVDSANLSPYDNYQLQFESALGGGWSNLSNGLFTPPGLTNSQFYLINNTNGFFRLQHLP